MLNVLAIGLILLSILCFLAGFFLLNHDSKLWMSIGTVSLGLIISVVIFLFVRGI